MSTRPAPRRRSRRSLARALVGVVLSLTAVLAPIDSPDLPPPLDGLVGAPTASAQSSTVFDGTPDSCPADPADTRGWDLNKDDESLCELRTFACAEHPLESGTYLDPSTEFPDFCEATVLESADAAMYQDCTELKGYVIKETGTAPDRECRMIQPARCAPGLHRVGYNTCLSVQRRTWSCEPGDYPRNQFNSCYRPPSDYTGVHPACGNGAPTFPIMTCEEYVAGDFERDPTTAEAACSRFDTGASPGLTDHSNQHWCRYDASLLDVACHGTLVSCDTSYAYCIKRASRTGGCDMVAETLRCRSLQAGYRYRGVPAEDVYQDGCTPCVVLPFSDVSSGCPRELTADPQSASRRESSTYDAIHRRRTDYAPGSTLCTDPPRGRLVWESSHHTRSAVVNSPIILNVVDIPSEQREVQGYDFVLQQGSRTLIKPRWPTRYFEYADSSAGDPVIRTWRTIDETKKHDDVSAMMRNRGGECRIKQRPDFRIIVQELWPDNDQSTIDELFGSGSLRWWGNLTRDERKRKTEARGLELIDSMMTQQQRDAELARRATALTKELRCNYGSSVWCKWLPERSGYYRVVAAGAWQMTTQTSSRQWRQNNAQSRQWGIINDWLRDNVGNDDGTCPGDLNKPSTINSFEVRAKRAKDYDCIMDDLKKMGYTHPDGTANPAAAGMLPDLDGLLPVGTSDEWLYSDAAGENFRCEPRDLRVSCGGTGSSFNYTETEPIGILVNEIRVTTVMPAR